MEPSQKDIEAVKAAYPDRSAHLVEVEVAGEVMHFIMTGPNRVEMRKLVREGEEAGGNSEKSLDAMERAVLAQIRWPSRSQAEALLERAPFVVKTLGDKLQEFAGMSAEVRAKKL